MNLAQTLDECRRICERFKVELNNAGEDNFYLKIIDRLANMAFLLAAANSIVSEVEINTINGHLKLCMDYYSLRDKYGLDCMSEDSFLHQVPDVIVTMAEIEKKQNPIADTFLRDTRTIYEAFGLMGRLMVDCNGSKLKYENMFLDFFMGRSLKYILSVESRDDFAKDMQIDYPSFYQYDESDNDDETEAAIDDEDYTIDQDKINCILKEIDKLIGLEQVKKEIHDMVNLTIVQKMRGRKGLRNVGITKHLVFSGNPGTGKTTIARKIAQLYAQLGITETDKLIETDRSDLVSGYMGQTAANVKKISNDAMGGILFIDEAYTLSSSSVENDYGQEAIDTLIKIMEDERNKLVVIVAGYIDEMEKFIDSNPGLRSRFNKYIHFEDYTDEDLLKIFEHFCREQDYTIDENAYELLKTKIVSLREEPGVFANARAVRNYFEKVISKQANRIVADISRLSAAELQHLITEDFM